MTKKNTTASNNSLNDKQYKLSNFIPECMYQEVRSQNRDFV